MKYLNNFYLFKESFELQTDISNFKITKGFDLDNYNQVEYEIKSINNINGDIIEIFFTKINKFPDCWKINFSINGRIESSNSNKYTYKEYMVSR